MLKKEPTIHLLTSELLTDLGLSASDVIQNNQWVFEDKLKKLSSEALSKVLLDLPYVQVKYHILCATLISNVQKYDQEEQKKYVASILVYAELLEHLRLQSSQLELLSIQRTRTFCRNYLQKIGLDITAPNKAAGNLSINDPHEDFIRSKTAQADFWRLMTLRGRRVLAGSILLINNFEYYGRFMTPLDAFLRTLIFYQACLLVPRFLTNVFHLFKHWYSPTKNEQSLSALQRHQVHLNMNARWWEIAYDFGWIATGLLNTFVLTGPLAPLAIYAAIICPTYNLFLHTTRLLIEDDRLKNLINNYKKQLKTSSANSTELTATIEQLEQRRAYHANTLILRMSVCMTIVATGFFVVFGGFMPPILPFLAAVVSVLATIAGKVVPTHLPKQKEQVRELKLDDSPSPLLKNSVFAPHKQTQSQADLATLVGEESTKVLPSL
ncbi:MAG: hypothetical protein P1U32_02345 [Legionellaceae bacterium]|nr:hypothetical protein [Legionellaceae bacterium]